MFRSVWLLLIPLLVTRLCAQQINGQDQVLQQILQRLDTLERQNRELLEEVKQLRQAQSPVAAAPAPTEPLTQPPIAERVKVAETRIEEQAQTKVESSQKFPLSLDGMLLFNAFANNQNAAAVFGGYGLLSGASRSGATLRQTMLGLEFHGPALPGGGHVEGDVSMDFWAGPPVPSDNWLRIRRAGVSLIWPTRSFFFGQDKPLIASYEPNSLAQVGVPSMAGSGNLWYWLPQVRFEQKVRFGAASGIKAQVAAVQVGGFLPVSTATASNPYPNAARPALQGRVAFWHASGDDKKFELAPGFQITSNRIAGTTIVSQLATFDWLYKLHPKLEWKGTGFLGRNATSLGGLGNSFYEDSSGSIHAARAAGGWTQLSSRLNNRVTLNVISGLENDQMGDNSDGAGIAHSLSFAGNIMFHLSPNVLLSLEAQRLWIRTFAGSPDSYNHYDLALAYLF